MTIRVRRIYDAPGDEDGYRVLVDRLWPRGISKDEALVGLWLRDISPSTDLRTWFGHRPERWEGFRERYTRELDANGALLDLIKDIEHHRGVVTLLFGARDEEHNEARVLAEVLGRHPDHAHH